MRVASRTISGLYDGATTAELISEEPAYFRLAARLLAGYIDKEVRNQGVASFSQSVALGHAEGLIGDETAEFVRADARKLDRRTAARPRCSRRDAPARSRRRRARESSMLGSSAPHAQAKAGVDGQRLHQHDREGHGQGPRATPRDGHVLPLRPGQCGAGDDRSDGGRFPVRGRRGPGVRPGPWPPRSRGRGGPSGSWG